MNQDQYQDPKMQGQPPPYSSGPQHQMHVMHPQVIHAPGTTVIHTNMPAVVPVVVGQQMGPKPAAITCKSCNHEIVTRVESKATMRTHLFALMLCIIGCWPCVFIPYCTDSCNNANHYCPNCQAYIGSYMN